MFLALFLFIHPVNPSLAPRSLTEDTLVIQS
ncbi:MAG: hypothetical protein BWY44_00664 [Candidatus Omnitrophica bacterium ADurb.Bin292]|nr:MAG: hypothetical protein BWY44_00664 [Candidatus Omnitrophica bacterium ADurb.Bin292]